MKFPCWSEYDSVFDGVDLEIHIVDHCNLNCAGCNHFCPLAEPFYISLEDFKNQLIMVKEKIPSLKWLMLLGGEPTLHPQLLELCQIARQLFPKIEIEILTNGKDLTSILKNKEEFIKLNIRITIATYNIKYNEDQIKEVLSMPLGEKSWGRESFTQTLVDVEGKQDKEKSFFKNCHHQLPCFTLKNYKIYECPFAAHIEHFSKKFNINIPEIKNEDYLELKDLTLEKLEKFSYQAKNICKFCKPGQNWVWHTSTREYNEYTKTLNELYFSDYKKYEEIKNLNSKYMKNSVLSTVDPNFGLSIINENKIKYFGKIDIIIPYFQVTTQQIYQLYNTLINQTIIKDCMIYFISDNSPNEKEVFSFFSGKTNLNCIFFKNTIRKGPGVARNKGIKFSNNKYIFFLDFDDEFSNNKALEKMYNLINYTKADAITVPRRNEKLQKLLQIDYFCNREFLLKNNIFYGEFFIHEDLVFNMQFLMYNGYIIDTQLDGILYKEHTPFSISTNTKNDEKIISKYYALYQISKKDKNDRVTSNILKEQFIDIDKTFYLMNIQQEEKIVVIISYLLLKSIKDFSNKEILNKIYNNKFLQQLNIKNFNQLEKVFFNYIKDYSKNIFLQDIFKNFQEENKNESFQL